MLSGINFRQLMSEDSTPAQRLALQVRGAAVIAASRNSHETVFSAREYSHEDVLNACAILRESKQFTEVENRSYPVFHIHVAW